MCTNMAVMAFVIYVPQDLRSREWKPSIPIFVSGKHKNVGREKFKKTFNGKRI